MPAFFIGLPAAVFQSGIRCSDRYRSTLQR